MVYSGNAVCADNSDIVPGTDCDDSDAQAYPGAAEIWYDDTDQACDGGDDFDQDGDGFQSETYGGSDCDDTNALINVDALEISMIISIMIVMVRLMSGLV